MVLPQGTVRVRERGSGPAVVFVHGILVNSHLWDGVVEQLGDDVRCVLPDLPLGAHELPMPPSADLSPPDVAKLVADLLAALDLDDVTLVGNDSGGAISQMVAANHPERVGRLVLTNCDALEVFPPKFFKPLVVALRSHALTRGLAETLRVRALRHGPLGLGRLAATPYDPALTDAWASPMRTNAGVRRDIAKVARGADARQTIEAAEKLRSFAGPIRLVWGAEDPFFTLDLARRLAAMLPDATITEVPGARCFVPLDAPERVAQAIREVVPQPAAA